MGAKHHYRVGDYVRFKEGRQIDWEVIGVLYPQKLGLPQQLTLESGMSNRTIRVASDRVKPRPTPPHSRSPR